MLLWHRTRPTSPQLYAFLSKHTPLPSTVVAQMHRVAALPEPHSRSNPQSESHGGDAHTPLTHSLPDVHALPQRPQCCRSVLVSRQLPSHTCTPAPPHTGAALGVALLLELLVVVVVLSDGSTVVDDSTLDKDVLLTKEVLLASVLDSLRLVVTMLDVDELGSPLLDDVIVSLPDGVTETLLDEVIVALPDDVTGMLLDEVIVSLPDDVTETLLDGVTRLLPDDVIVTLSDTVIVLLPDEVTETLLLLLLDMLDKVLTADELELLNKLDELLPVS